MGVTGGAITRAMTAAYESRNKQGASDDNELLGGSQQLDDTREFSTSSDGAITSHSERMKAEATITAAARREMAVAMIEEVAVETQIA